MAYSVSVAVGESETTQLGFAAALAPLATMRGSANALKKSARANRRDLNMDISFPSKWVGDGWISERPLLTSRAVFHISSRKATWLHGRTSTTTYSCGTALESHQLRCHEALSTLLHSSDGHPVEPTGPRPHVRLPAIDHVATPSAHSSSYSSPRPSWWARPSLHHDVTSRSSNSPRLRGRCGLGRRVPHCGQIRRNHPLADTARISQRSCHRRQRCPRR